MIYNTVDGNVLAVASQFLDDLDNPIIPKPGYPRVRLVDLEGELLSSTMAVPTLIPGEWSANLTIPNMDLTDAAEFKVKWIVVDLQGNTHKERDTVIINPKTETRTKDIVTLFGDNRFDLVIPSPFDITKDAASWQLYTKNIPLVSSGNSDLAQYFSRTLLDKSIFQPPVIAPKASLTSSLIRVLWTPASASSDSYLYKMWCVTPQILLASTMVEEFLNKSHIENVIPELRYNDSDLLAALERGLYMFNTLYIPTSFDGTNMQGPLLDGWVTCACYYAICAQLLAEGSLSFDFSGQGISLNVDRTPQLDGAIGRIEGIINDRLVTLKKHLQTQQILTGNGSIGATVMQNCYAKGTLAMINAATTRIRGISNVFLGRRY